MQMQRRHPSLESPPTSIPFRSILRRSDIFLSHDIDFNRVCTTTFTTFPTPYSLPNRRSRIPLRHFLITIPYTWYIYRLGATCFPAASKGREKREASFWIFLFCVGCAAFRYIDGSAYWFLRAVSSLTTHNRHRSALICHHGHINGSAVAFLESFFFLFPFFSSFSWGVTVWEIGIKQAQEVLAARV